MSVPPGSYLRDMREANGRSLTDVVKLLGMLKFCGVGRPWPWAGEQLVEHLRYLEAGRVTVNHNQLLTLSLVIADFRPARFQELLHLRLKEAALG